MPRKAAFSKVIDGSGQPVNATKLCQWHIDDSDGQGGEHELTHSWRHLYSFEQEKSKSSLVFCFCRGGGQQKAALPSQHQLDEQQETHFSIQEAWVHLSE